MKLTKLSANKDSFHTISFKDGLNLIVGKQANPDDTNKKNTYNGVGKSLIIYLIHFCLGSNQIKEFTAKIPDWEFTLEFTIGENKYTTRRHASNQKDIYLNDVKCSLTNFRKKMLPLIFNLDCPKKYLTFNTLFPRFIRRDRACYTRYDTYIKEEREYPQLLNNAFLLGLDINKVIEKRELRELDQSTTKLSKSLAKDPVLQEHFDNREDTDLEIRDLEEEIKKLEVELSSFKVAKNYQDIEKEADKISYDLKRLQNKRTLIDNSIKNIEKSLDIKSDISQDKILQLYQQANIEIPEMITKKVEAVVDFHQKLISTRKKRLYEELKKNKNLLAEIDKDIELKSEEQDRLLDYLNTHGALDEYVSLTKKVNDMKIKLDKLTEYQRVLKTYKKKLRNIQSKYTENNLETEEYLEAESELLDKIMDTFRDLSREFYEKPGGIKITNNEGENTLRYNINAKIQDDSSDGVNEVKIFCFDMTLLLLQQNHTSKFMFHDSRLFSNMDPRQRYTLFRLAFEKTMDEDLQYIATVNQDILDSIEGVMESKTEYHKIIENNIILTLTDESDESKLLGIQVDMDYEK